MCGYIIKKKLNDVYSSINARHQSNGDPNIIRTRCCVKFCRPWLFRAAGTRAETSALAERSTKNKKKHARRHTLHSHFVSTRRHVCCVCFVRATHFFPSAIKKCVSSDKWAPSTSPHRLLIIFFALVIVPRLLFPKPGRVHRRAGMEIVFEFYLLAFLQTTAAARQCKCRARAAEIKWRMWHIAFDTFDALRRLGIKQTKNNTGGGDRQGSRGQLIIDGTRARATHALLICLPPPAAQRDRRRLRTALNY